MINRIIKKGSFNYIVTLAIFLISVSFLTRGSVIDQRNEIKLVPKHQIEQRKLHWHMLEFQKRPLILKKLNWIIKMENLFMK